MTAVEALRRANATMDHADDWRSDVNGLCELSHQTLLEVHHAERDLCIRETHFPLASALLDGFSVEEVTAAEHATDQPHE